MKYVIIGCLGFVIVPIFAANKQKERDIYEFIAQLPEADKKRKIYDAYREGGHLVHVNDDHAIRHVARRLQKMRSIMLQMNRSRFKILPLDLN